MDDIISGAETLHEASKLQHELVDLLKEGQFELRKWASNEPAIINQLDSSVENQLAVSFEEDENPCIKILGLEWCPKSDSFKFSVSPINREPSKRAILSELARIFDPLGFLCPLTLLAKCIMQELWSLAVGWDDPVPEHVAEQWAKYQAQLYQLSDMEIPRHVISPKCVSTQLHGFADASERGYGAVVYFRVVRNDQMVVTRLVCARSRVAPLKRLSIPRLELCAAVLLSDLIHFVKKTCTPQVTFEDIVAWSDSTIVLYWVRSQPGRYRPFVGNRIGHIQEKLDPKAFRHVRSWDNPADHISRGLMPVELIKNALWWAGPAWLRAEPNEWPITRLDLSSPKEDKDERKANVCLVVKVNEFDTFISRHSSLSKMQRIVGYCMRFIKNCQLSRDKRQVSALTVWELNDALFCLIRIMQKVMFKCELKNLQDNRPLSKPLRKLCPFVDSSGILRVGGRLEYANLAFEQKHPALLPRNHHLTKLIIEDAHVKYLHPGFQNLHYLLREKFWILSPKRAIRNVIVRCLKCFRVKPKATQPQMASLPATRVQQLKAFSVVGVDFGGPFQTALSKGRGRRTQKSYICVFVCHATKAIHIELVSDLSSEAFIAALRRFVARRGQCVQINCDRGTNFVGAARLLKETMRAVSDKENIHFQFNPPNAPHFGGLFEAGIKSVKSHLSRVIGKQILTFEEMYTVLVQIEAVLNSRPLCPVSSDPNDLSALTPGHFLTMLPLTTLPEPDVTELKLNRLNRWQLLQRIHQDFWKRWNREYLGTLNQRAKWTQGVPNVKEGTLVLVKDDQLPPLKWCLARIVKLHHGKDGVARVATIQTSTGSRQRPVNKLCPLPIYDK